MQQDTFNLVEVVVRETLAAPLQLEIRVGCHAVRRTVDSCCASWGMYRFRFIPVEIARE